MPAKKANSDFFEQGVICYLSKKMSYSKTELISANSGFEEEAESDLDDGLEESDEDPRDEFMDETEQLVEEIL